MPPATPAWPEPDEPLPVDRAVHAAPDPAAPGARRGKPWSTGRFRSAGQALAQRAGRRAEAAIGPGFRAKGLP
ncbi:hypothetical protein [Streptomyces sp. NBC_01334]|uniref:hypothetical protein n=1 Tax=Streptomyces sp. NBC_01334 TaxID=2903827 RepID=UPI002E0DDFB3|nr:hypothetical protein OG736_33775 [Streptomyces sp. NBC_01334]